MTTRVLVFLAIIFSACSRPQQMKEQNSDKERVAMWYQAFATWMSIVRFFDGKSMSASFCVPVILARTTTLFPSWRMSSIVSFRSGIHEVKDGKIIRTWHTEDWMSGLRQLGVFEK